MPRAVAELGERFSLERAVNYGLLPSVWFSDEPEEGAFAHRVVVCREPLERRVDGIEILPFAAFVDRLWSDALIDLDSVALA